MLPSFELGGKKKRGERERERKKGKNRCRIKVISPTPSCSFLFSFLRPKCWCSDFMRNVLVTDVLSFNSPGPAMLYLKERKRKWKKKKSSFVFMWLYIAISDLKSRIFRTFRFFFFFWQLWIAPLTTASLQTSRLQKGTDLIIIKKERRNIGRGNMYVFVSHLFWKSLRKQCRRENAGGLPVT